MSVRHAPSGTLEIARPRAARSRALHVAGALAAFAIALLAAAAEKNEAATGAWPHVAEIDWASSPLDLDLRGMNGERYRFHCPPGKPLPSRVIGSGPYTDDSSICSAAVHAGAIGAKDGGDVAIEIRPGEARYAGSERNYIRSMAYERPWSGSFVVLRKDTTAPP
jgi:hypothetical protein